MTEQEFLKEFHRLEGGFPFLSRNPEDRKSREAAYWSVVREFPGNVWRSAATMILENWTEETFPIPFVVKSYLEREVERHKHRKPQEECAKCDGTGWEPFEDSGVRRVRECQCLNLS